MTATSSHDLASLAEAVAAGDENAFAELAARHRRELHVHCYRILASFDDADDAVQETFLKAWRNREMLATLQHRAWLYKIATNVCIDLIRARSRQAQALKSYAGVPWLQPYPDQLLDEIASTADPPDQAAVERETIELTFLAALQSLPPRQRAALVIRDVLGWSAAETASLLETSVPAANSALQRARVTIRKHLPPDRAHWRTAQPTQAEREVLERFMSARERTDAAAMARIAAADVRLTMPPYPHQYHGVEDMLGLLDQARSAGEWRVVATAANRMPAAASYLRRDGDMYYRPFKIDVLRITDRTIVEVTTFDNGVFAAFGLPPVLD